MGVLPGLKGNHLWVFSESGCGEQQCLWDLSSTLKPAEVQDTHCCVSLGVSGAPEQIQAGLSEFRNGLTHSGLRCGMTQWKNSSAWNSRASC